MKSFVLEFFIAARFANLAVSPPQYPFASHRMEEVISAPRSPWQNPYVERLIGSIRRECLDHIIVWNERSLRRTLKDYFAYYQRSRTHLALAKDAPESRVVEKPESGCIVAIPQLGGLHHRYQRHAA